MTETLRPRRNLTLAALVLFAAAYAAILILVFAPRHMFSATPASLVQPME